MYRCDDCNEIFDTPKEKRELMGECHGVPAYEKYNVCTHCRSEEVTEVDQCACGEYKSITEDYCESCKNFVSNAVSEFIDSVQQYLHISYKDAVQIILDDIERR